MRARGEGGIRSSFSLSDLKISCTYIPLLQNLGNHIHATCIQSVYTVQVCSPKYVPIIPHNNIIQMVLFQGMNYLSNFQRTTDLNNQCTTSFSGTSAATPMVSGIIALTLEAKYGFKRGCV